MIELNIFCLHLALLSVGFVSSISSVISQPVTAHPDTADGHEKSWRKIVFWQVKEYCDNPPKEPEDEQFLPKFNNEEADDNVTNYGKSGKVFNWYSLTNINIKYLIIK